MPIWAAVAAVAAYVFVPPIRAAVNAVFQWTIDGILAVVRLITDGIMALVNVLINTVKDLVDFVGQFLSAIAQYFQGDFVKAILRIVLVAAFLWIYELAKTIPGIAGVLDQVVGFFKQVNEFVNTQINSVLGFIEQLRSNTNDALTNLLGDLGDFGKQLTGDILGQVDRVFSGLESRFGNLRFELLARVDVLRIASNLQVTVLGAHLRILPEQVRKDLLTAWTVQGEQAVVDQLGISAEVGPGLGTAAAASSSVFDTVDEALRTIAGWRAGGTDAAFDIIDEAVQDILALQAGTPASAPPWPDKLEAPADAPLPDVPIDLPPIPETPEPDVAPPLVAA